MIIEMLTEIEILKQIREEIKSVYKEIPVFLDSVKDNFGDKAFFLKSSTLRRPSTQFINFNSTQIYITYFSTKGKTKEVDLYQIKDTLAGLFWAGLKVEERYLHTDSLDSNISGNEADIITITITFKYFDSIQKQEPKETMNKLNQTIK